MLSAGIKRLLLAVIILISIGLPCYGQQNDILVSGRTNYIQLSSPNGIAWNTLSNQTYFYTPLNPDQNSCLYVVNNNPTNAHTLTGVNTFQTGDSNVTDFSHNTGRWVSVPNTTTLTGSGVPANTTLTVFFKVNASAKTAVQFTGGATAAGNPDTVDLYIVQTSSNTCGTIGAINNAASQGISAVNGTGLSNIPLYTTPGNSATTNAPATGTVATNGLTAVTSVRHIANCVGFSAGAIAAPVATILQVNLRDGASGIGTPLLSWTVNIPASTGQFVNFMQCGLNVVGTAGNQMVLEFSGGLANLNESIVLTSYNVN